MFYGINLFQGLLRSISLLKEQYGSIYITLGPEISLKRFKMECNNSDVLLMNLGHNIVRRYILPVHGS